MTMGGKTMITDTLEHASLYENSHPGFRTAFRFLCRCLREPPVPGTYELDGQNVYASVQSYLTEPAQARPWEAHRRFIDIQCVLRGTEQIGVLPIEQLSAAGIYQEEKDCITAPPEQGGLYVRLEPGSFSILYPHEAHQPRCADRTPGQILKVVVKVRADIGDPV